MAQNLTMGEGIKNSMNDLFSRVSSAQVEGIQTDKAKSGEIVASKEYTFTNPIGKRNSVKVFDKAIIESTEKIAMALYGGNVLAFAVCREFAKINDKAKLESMGFKNIGEYGSALFDIAPLTVRQYARIGRIFIDDDYKIASSILPQSLQRGHLLEFLKFIDDDTEDISKIEELYLSGTLTDGMGTKKIRSILKATKESENAIETNAEEVSDTEDKVTVKKVENGAGSAKTETAGEGTTFDVQIEVGKILSACNDIMQSFDVINAHEFTVGGYDKAVDTIRALAQGILS